ncbi:MAG TPA: pentapeptide repeat-containing protein, partial [Polyangiaceae bacterium]|nr:pentapeptide repeat-containing protein [Polyangiaceae bacterium]
MRFDLSFSNLDNVNILYFTDVDLSKTFLYGASLIRARLSGAKLGCVFWDANLTGAWLDSCNLEGADLEAANLSDADLEKTRFSNAKLKKANLSKARLEGADLTEAAELATATLTGATYDKTTKLPTNLDATARA